MIKDFLILNFIGEKNKIGLRISRNFHIHEFDKNTDNDQLVPIVLNMFQKHKVIIDDNFSILVNVGPGSFSTLRSSIAVAKGISLSKKINLYGFKNSDLGQFNLVNIELLIKKKLLQKNLINPIYLS
tara:strand:- start:13 stop:393 length:381 start_codon:yes stop_codon:yes gene_type:complete